MKPGLDFMGSKQLVHWEKNNNKKLQGFAWSRDAFSLVLAFFVKIANGGDWQQSENLLSLSVCRVSPSFSDFGSQKHSGAYILQRSQHGSYLCLINLSLLLHFIRAGS